MALSREMYRTISAMKNIVKLAKQIEPVIPLLMKTDDGTKRRTTKAVAAKQEAAPARKPAKKSPAVKKAVKKTARKPAKKVATTKPAKLSAKTSAPKLAQHKVSKPKKDKALSASAASKYSDPALE